MIGVEFQSCDINEDNCVMMNNDGSRGRVWVACGERKKERKKIKQERGLWLSL